MLQVSDIDEDIDERKLRVIADLRQRERILKLIRVLEHGKILLKSDHNYVN